MNSLIDYFERQLTNFNMVSTHSYIRFKVLNESFKNLVAGFNSQVNYKRYLGVDGASAMGGIMFVSSFFLLIGLILPSFKKTPWVMKCAYPWGAMIISVFLIVIFDRRKKGI
jgi:hypothetical protein